MKIQNPSPSPSPSSNLSASQTQNKKGRLTLILVLATALAPIILALIFYFYYSKHPSMQTRNYGDLVQPMRKIPQAVHAQEQTQTPYQYVDGDWQVAKQPTPKNMAEKNIKLNDFSGKWLMVYYQTANTCDEVCVKHLYVLRQLRLSLGKEGGRFIPIWLKGDAQLMPDLQKLYDNPHSSLRLLKINHQANAVDAKILENWLKNPANPSENMQSGLYLIDPEMNYIMRYPNIQEPLKIIKDLQLLLKWSRIG